MTKPAESELRQLILSLHDEATLTARAKGMTGAVAELVALQETASLASGPARRTMSEEEVMRLVLQARRLGLARQDRTAATPAERAARRPARAPLTAQPRRLPALAAAAGVQGAARLA
ncbi:hypothetical protein [Azospirillum sp. SYSU D00513]|uniref:hypothetical protein n=1 Tax=Azospirillum sp. SYSU D00513 TaxID=2812561 RepID=UPI001A965823|nr:hypothetical protein [Azospirillum sp. SYSU D00513]